jgi:hypothetical protein
MYIILQIQSLLCKLKPQQSAASLSKTPPRLRGKGHFALYYCLVRGHTNFTKVQRISSSSYPTLPQTFTKEIA